MVWFMKRKGSQQQSEQGREALAASLEELTRGGQPGSEEWEEDMLHEAKTSSTDSALLISPRLRLQSRSWPVVRAGSAQQSVSRESEGQTNASLPASSILPGKRLGHSTKVHLQAVRPAQPREPVTGRVPSIESTESRESIRQGQALIRRVESPGESADTPSTTSPSALICGSGVIEKGQGEATIRNARISARSVVTVMLAANPGPVAVHYVTLHPRAGFTLHMSAPVSATTPFTYAAWLF